MLWSIDFAVYASFLMLCFEIEGAPGNKSLVWFLVWLPLCHAASFWVHTKMNNHHRALSSFCKLLGTMVRRQFLEKEGERWAIWLVLWWFLSPLHFVDGSWPWFCLDCNTGIGLLAILSCIHIPLAGDTLHTTLAVSNILRTTFIHIFKLVGRLLGKFWENASIGTSKYFFAEN